MSKIVFFCIPASGHTNPTIGVVRELVNRGHQVWYYSFEPFREKLEAAGAKFVSCDGCDRELHLTPEEGTKVGKDMAFSIKILVDSTLALDEMVCRHMEELRPDCIVADSMAVWGKAAAMKLHIPFVSSTTTFAFNRHSAKIMKQSLSQVFGMIFSMPRINQDMERLKAAGYPVGSFLDLIQNDESVNTVVYTSREFQPCTETFPENYAFVGPSIRSAQENWLKSRRKTVYVSMGTVNNRMKKLYKNCIKAFKDSEYDVIMSIGDLTGVEELGKIPENFTVKNRVDQIAVLQAADIFLSHCGMNSVNESLYFGVPLVCFPQTAEQGGVARRVRQLEAGVFLKNDRPKELRKAVESVLGDEKYRRNALIISESFKRSGGAKTAAEAILRVAKG